MFFLFLPPPSKDAKNYLFLDCWKDQGLLSGFFQDPCLIVWVIKYLLLKQKKKINLHFRQNKLKMS